MYLFFKYNVVLSATPILRRNGLMTAFNDRNVCVRQEFLNPNQIRNCHCVSPSIYDVVYKWCLENC